MFEKVKKIIKLSHLLPVSSGLSEGTHSQSDWHQMKQVLNFFSMSQITDLKDPPIFIPFSVNLPTL